MADDAVRYELSEHVLTLTLNRAEERNNMTDELLDAIADAAKRAASEKRARCVVVTGSGANFCGGADLNRGFQRAGHAMSNEASLAMYEPFLTFLDVPVPVIAAMQGHAIGGGLGLALVCDIRIASREAKYGANFVRLGLHPGMATTYLLPRLIGMAQAADLLLTGRLVDGAEAERLGLVNEATDSENVLARAQEIAAVIAAAAPIAVRWTKQSLYENAAWSPRPFAAREAHLQSRTLESEDCREGVAALLEKRRPRFQGR